MLSRHPDEVTEQEGAARKRWMAVLARAPRAELERLWREHGIDAALPPLRPVETGLVMVRGRAGGTGRRFNLGEVTVTRATVRGPDGSVGHAYVRGRDKAQADLAARFDALLQDRRRRPALMAAVVEPLAAAEQARRDRIAAKAAATKVDFFTMVRGD